MSSLPLFPANIIDLVGSGLAILLSFTALFYSRRLVALRPNNFIWGFLFYFCMAMALFSLSRGVGHIFRTLLVFNGQGPLWSRLSPFSGGVNTMLMIGTAAVTIYYHKGLAAYKAIRSEAKKLADVNIHLEEIVEERTRNLSESENKFRNFFENSKDIIYFSDAEGMITSINSTGRELLDITEERNVNFYDLFLYKKDRQRYQDELRINGFISDIEIECRGRESAVLQILFTARAVYNGNGDIIGCEGIGKDMTRIKTITKQLINREKMATVGEMAAGVAHEINTPLGIILGYTQLMQEDFPEGSEEHSNLQVMERQTKICRRIVADLLKFSRQTKSVKAAFDLNQIIEDVLAVTEHSLNMQQISVVRKLAPYLPDVFGDAERISQVFVNLLNNSQQAMARTGGKIIITTRQVDSVVEVSVMDTGTGIPEDIRNKIFNPFFTTKEVGKGTGLGLSVTYGIIQEHGGTIQVESPLINPDTQEQFDGTVFHIRLPASDENSGDDKKET
jgi:PAS domain S-box-containing protein